MNCLVRWEHGKRQEEAHGVRRNFGGHEVVTRRKYRLKSVTLKLILKFYLTPATIPVAVYTAVYVPPRREVRGADMCTRSSLCY
eukprot:SAG31_NODE_369_length_16731_cov_36.453283_3_plen_84_part_00